MEINLTKLSPQARELIDLLNSDPYIGPSAPGDGDIIEWWFGFVLVLLAELSRIAGVKPTGTLDIEPPNRIKGAKFPVYCEALAQAMVEGMYPDLDQSGLATWRAMYAILEREQADKWGGRRVRISVRPKKRNSTEKIAQGLRAGLPLDDVFSKAGVSRATGYRILRRKQ